VVNSILSKTTWIGLVRHILQFGEELCGGAVGKNKEKLLDANFQSILIRIKMMMMLIWIKRSIENYVYAARSMDI